VAGLFCPSTDASAKNLNARRLGTLSELAAKALVEKSTEAACASSFATLAKNPDDMPFALLYLLDTDGRHALLEQSAGVAHGIAGISPAQVDLEKAAGEAQLWPIGEVLSTMHSQVMPVGKVEKLPLGLAQQRVTEAIVLPVTSRGQSQPIGVLIAGINPARKLDAEYRTFYELIASQVATAVQNARAAEEERKRLEALAEIDRAKTAFFSNVSHEFRTPLTLMLGPVEDLLAKSHTDLSPSAKNQLELVKRNGARLLRLVNTLLDFSRIEAGRMQVTYQPTDLSAFTIELASVFRSATEKAGLRLELECALLAEPVYVDRDMWEKIVLNLMSNAFKFTFEGGITISLKQAGNDAELRVRDTGVGIPAKELPRLFDRFHRVQETRSRTHEGSGIGLALVQELAKLHGGSVQVESTLGEGTTFIVSVPLGKEHLPANRISGNRSLASTALGAAPFVEEALRWLPEAEEPEPTVTLPLGTDLLPVPCPPGEEAGRGADERPRVLVADDNADMRQYLVRLLAERYDVEAVSNGQAALEAVRKRKPELILTDVMMPQLDGFGLLRELRGDLETSGIPVILLSARAGEESRVEGIERGADDYLIKPFSARELLARVQTHVELARMRKQGEEAMRRRTEQFETLLNAAPLGVYVVDGDFRILQVNPTARSVFGEIPELIGRDFNEVIHLLWPKPFADEVSRLFRHTLDTGEPFVAAEWTEERRDRAGREFYEWQINRIPLPDGRYGVVCYFRDISSQVRTREVLRESEDRLRGLTDALEQQVRTRTEQLEQRNREVVKQSEMLRELSHRLMQMQDNERRHIARELHDSAGQTLTALGMNLASVVRRAKEHDAELGREAEEAQELVRELSKEIRTTSYLLHPPLLDESGIAEALQWYINGLRDRSGLNIQLTVEPNFGRLSNEMELALFRVVQECLTNVHRHSGSKVARIRVAREGGKVLLEVQDEGHGISREKLAEIQSQGAGVGLRGMRERVLQLGGEMKIESGRGTRILVTLPGVAPAKAKVAEQVQQAQSVV